MMIRSVPCESPYLNCPRLSPATICCSSRNNAYIPKLEPFSRSKLDRAVRDPPLIQKSENDLADYCSTLEGDPSYSCWRAYFELKELEKEAPKEEVERVIIESGGVKSLVRCLHGISEIYKAKKQTQLETGSKNDILKPENVTGAERTCPVPDGLPKSREEMEEDEKGRMPDSSFTRLLRTKDENRLGGLLFPQSYSGEFGRGFDFMSQSIGQEAIGSTKSNSHQLSSNANEVQTKIPRKKSRLRSEVWDNFDTINDEKCVSSKAKCKYCGREFCCNPKK